ncbi:hypothetical protein Tco_0707812 [Tanacetum coccineum]
MDDPNITMEEYIMLEEEKARRHGKVYNWETTTYGKIWCDKDVHDLRSVETEFPAIVFDDAFTSKVTHSYEPTDKNSFSYKIISKTDLEYDNDKVNMPSFLAPEPTFSYFNDLDFFKDFENKFPAIVYNDALTSKSDFLTEPIVSPGHIDEFDLKSETSLSEYKDNDDDKIDIKQSSKGNVINTDDGAYAQRNNTAYPRVWDTTY